MELSLWWALLAIGACADRRDALGRVSAEDARRLVTDDDRAWLGSSGSSSGDYGSGYGYSYGGDGDGDGSGSSDGSGYGYGSDDGDGDGGVYGDGSSDGGSGIGSGSGRGDGIVSLTIDGVRRTPDEIRIWLIEMATEQPWS